MIDSHCHLDFTEFATNLTEILVRANQVGVDKFIVPSVDEKSWQQVEKIASTNPDIYPAFGFHPWFLDNPPDIVALDQWLLTHSTIAIGECGLDFYSGRENTQLQYDVFTAQLNLAQKHKLPVIVHSRKAVDEVLSIIKSMSGITGVLHSFAGSWQQAQAAIKLKLYLGIGLIICNPKAKKIRQLVSQIPLTSILLETDSPDQKLANSIFGQPADIIMVARELAVLQAVSLDLVLVQCTQNTYQCFNL